VIRLGTRGSAMALAQAHAVAALLGDGVEVVPVVTTGDRERARTDKEKWVKELELALLAEEVDLAVHSAKDVPARLPDGLELVGAPVRGDARDALCGAPSLDALRRGARVGTSALRRASQLRASRDDLEIVEVRGNVDTRLRRLADGEVDALVLTAAGLARLGRADAIGAALDTIPAAGQGIVALEARAEDVGARAAAARITDEAAWTALACERALVRVLGASCHTPVGAHATLGPAGALMLETFVGLPDGSAWVRDLVEGSTAEPGALGALGAQRLLGAGAGELLRQAEETAA
jgi:hydroxymethylbilane synthase